MRPKPVLLVALCLPVLLLPAAAYAQTSPTALPPVSLPIAVTTIVSLLLGLLNMVAQGSILNLVPVPKPWAGPATIAATFLTGVGSFLATAAQPYTGSTAFYALAFGLFGLFGGSLPAFAIHGHVTLPKAMRMMRKGVIPAVMLMATAAMLQATACTPATQATISKVDQTIANDLTAGKSLPEIEADVNAILGKPVIDLETIIMDGIAFVIDLGILPADKVPHAEGMRDEIRARKGISIPTHLLRASPSP
jgi:hypothetical protein